MNNKELREAAEKAYTLKGATVIDFAEDFARFGYCKRLINRWHGGEKRPHLLVNHVYMLFATFDPFFVRFALKLTFPEPEDWLIINTVITFLGREYDRVSVSQEIIDLIGECLNGHNSDD